MKSFVKTGDIKGGDGCLFSLFILYIRYGILLVINNKICGMSRFIHKHVLGPRHYRWLTYNTGGKVQHTALHAADSG